MGGTRISLEQVRWRYRGEGNANLVLSLPHQRLIVRLRKHEASPNVGSGESVDEKAAAVLEALFCKVVVAPLLGEAFIQAPSLAFLELAEVSALERRLLVQRPSHRHHKGLRRGYAMVFPDYALLPAHLARGATTPTFCVEVKPKQGWVPPADRRLSRCAFCLNQFLKLRRNSIRARSAYCPLDLFSGDAERMARSLQELLASPQNNLKIFRDGIVVYGGDGAGQDLHAVLRAWFLDESDLASLVRRLCAILLTALTRDLCVKLAPDWSVANVDSTEEPPPVATFPRLPPSLVTSVAPLLPPPPCDWTSDPLPPGCILARILRMQQLDRCGADHVYGAYVAAGAGSVSDYGYVAELVDNPAHMSALHGYLLATTAKDCSVMLAFQRRTAGDVAPVDQVVCDPDSADSFVFNIGVSDLDPKPVSCVEKHRKRDCDILTSCLDLLRNEA